MRVSRDIAQLTLRHSEAFDDAAWVRAKLSVQANAGYAPDNVLDADRLIEGLTSGNHEIRQDVTKPAGLAQIYLMLDDGTSSVFLSRAQVCNGSAPIGCDADVNRTRLRSGRAKAAMRRRAEIVERSFAHNLKRGGMRRTWLRGRTNAPSSPDRLAAQPTETASRCRAGG